MARAVPICTVATQENAPLMHSEYQRVFTPGNQLHLAKQEDVAATFPALIGAPPCKLTDQEWQRINQGMFLTARELDVVKGIMIGESEAGIAVQLGISTNTVHTHLGRVYRKLGVRSAAALVLRVFAAYVQSTRHHATPRPDEGIA